jgi:hypothetical protein
MALSYRLLSAVTVLGAVLVEPAVAIWPKRGLAYNDGIPISAFGGAGSQVNCMC